ncbi:MAG: glycosyltransferase family 4 protein [Acholeplasma sp.]|nr:glycosyltransferase family 4 protein [Acholeplasma sp.]
MNITFVLFYYLPEKPTQNYIYQPIIDGLLDLGHTVNIITPNPTRGISKAEQKKYKKIKYEKIGNLHIHRANAFTYNPHRFSKLKLLFRYISVSLKLPRKLRKVKSDVVFTQTNPPILMSYLVSRFTKKKKIKLVYNVQDLYPDNIFKPQSLLYKLTNPFQVKTLNNANTVITISETMKRTLLTKIKDESKIKVIYNFAISEYKSDEKKEEVRNRLNIRKDKFNVIYAGNIGYVQDLDVLLRAAELTKDNAYINYHIIGEGSQAQRIKHKIMEMKLDKVYFHPVQPIGDAVYLYHLADVNVISILPNVIRTALPLKVASCLEANKAIIFIGLEDDINEPWLDKTSIVSINNRDYHELFLKLQHLSTKQNNDYRHDTICFDKNANICSYIQTLL